MDRTDPDLVADDLTMMTQYLDYHRATLVQKASGLTRAQMGARLPTSELTLAGLVKHLAHVEDEWFGVVLAGQPRSEPWAGAPWEEDRDWELHTAPDDDPEELLALYVETCERSRAHVAAVGDADAMSVGTRHGDHVSLRWILLHMLEETARHNGHADLLRESIDGATGE